jgi:hypothetical protein
MEALFAVSVVAEADQVGAVAVGAVNKVSDQVNRLSQLCNLSHYQGWILLI